MVTSNRGLKIGALLIGLELVSQEDLNQVVDMAAQVGMPLGRALVLDGKITENQLKTALQLHELMKTVDIPVSNALNTFKMISEHGISFSDALLKSGWVPPVPLESKQGNRLGSLLVASKLVTAEQLEEARETSRKLGIPLGRTLTLMKLISHPVLTRVLDLQSSIRANRIENEEAVEYLMAEFSPMDSGSEGRQPVDAELTKQILNSVDGKKTIRLGELLMLSGVLTEADLMNAVELSFSRGEPLGSILITLGLISKDNLDLALDLQSLVSDGSVTMQAATDTLMAKTQSRLLAEAADSRKDEKADENDKDKASDIRLGDLLAMAGIVEASDIQKAIEGAFRFPSVVGRMLVVSGLIEEATLLAALRCQFLLRNRLIALEPAVEALKFARDNQLSLEDAMEELGVIIPVMV